MWICSICEKCAKFLKDFDPRALDLYSRFVNEYYKCNGWLIYPEIWWEHDPVFLFLEFNDFIISSDIDSQRLLVKPLGFRNVSLCRIIACPQRHLSYKVNQ